MRVPLPILCALLLAAPAARAQSSTAPCTPRVEATPRVPPATLAALTAALSSDGSVDGSCPVVRFDVANNHLVLTAVLDDGRQIARVLRHSRDALPTLVALLAVPALPIEGLAEPEVPTTPAAPATAPVAPTREAPRGPSPVAPSRAFHMVAPTPLPVTGAALRVGVWGGFGASEHVSLVRLGVDLDHVRRDWTFGLRGDYNREGIRWTRGEGFMVAASARARWTTSRWEFDAGPALGVRALGSRQGDSVVLRMGGEASAAFAVTRSLSVFARGDLGIDFLMAGVPSGWRPQPGVERDDEDGSDLDPVPDADDMVAWSFSVGLRWVVWR